MYAPGSDPHRRFYARFAKAAYGNSSDVPEGYYADAELSNRNRVVYVDAESKRAVIAFRGTQPTSAEKWNDFGTDVGVALGIESVTPRFRQALRTGKQARAKYPDYEITATGHSLGASQALYLNKRMGIPAVSFSEHVPFRGVSSEITSGILEHALGPSRVKRVTRYTTALDPIAATTNISTRHHVVPQSQKDPHSIDNFIL
jgi:hypothetical protein